MAHHAAHGGDALTQDAAEASAIEEGRRLFAQDCRFVAAAAGRAALPPPGLPEVAFAGRSNVGKSSLINALTGRTALARVADTPGRTQQLNFFELGGRLLLVDLPGYGYARAARSRVRDWTRLAEDYLRGRPTLRRLCLLIDARHGFKESDRGLMALLDAAALSYQVVLTKLDKLPPDALEAQRVAIAAELARRPAAHPAVVATSARSGDGIAELRAALAALATPQPFR